MKFDLVREPDNEFDPDAVAIYHGDVRVGYAANSSHTCCHLTSRASDIQDASSAEYLFYFAYRYHIARIIW